MTRGRPISWMDKLQCMKNACQKRGALKQLLFIVQWLVYFYTYYVDCKACVVNQQFNGFGRIIFRDKQVKSRYRDDGFEFCAL
jgi:hypothetical protein